MAGTKFFPHFLAEAFIPRLSVGGKFSVTAEARTALVDAINDAYEQRLQERMEQSEDAPAQGMEQQM